MAAHPETSVLILDPLLDDPFHITRAYIRWAFGCYGTIWQSGYVGGTTTQPLRGLEPSQLFFRFDDDVSTYRFMTDTDGKLFHANQIIGVRLIPSSAIMQSELSDGSCMVVAGSCVSDRHHPADVQYLNQIINAAVQRAKQIGQDILGICLRKLYEESLFDEAQLNMLKAVIKEHPTQQDVRRFQRHIRATRRLIAASDGASETTGSVVALGP